MSDSASYKFRFISNHPKGEYPGDPEIPLEVAGKLVLPINAVCVCVSVCVCVHLIIFNLIRGRILKGLLLLLQSVSFPDHPCPRVTTP